MIPVARPSIVQDELQARAEVFASNWLRLGEKTKLFGEALKHYLGCRHVAAVNTGTTALHLGLDALGVSAGACRSTAFFCCIVEMEPDKRATFMEHLRQRGVGSGIHYIPNHRHFSAAVRAETSMSRNARWVSSSPCPSTTTYPRAKRRG